MIPKPWLLFLALLAPIGAVATDRVVVTLQDEYVVAACDIGGCQEIYRGPDPVQAGAAAADYREKNPDEYPPLIRHDYFARVD